MNIYIRLLPGDKTYTHRHTITLHTRECVCVVYARAGWLHFTRPAGKSIEHAFSSHFPLLFQPARLFSSFRFRTPSARGEENSIAGLRLFLTWFLRRARVKRAVPVLSIKAADGGLKMTGITRFYVFEQRIPHS